MAKKRASRNSEKAKHESPDQLFAFDRADITAIATYSKKRQRVEFKVSSHALCHASPVWKKFIFPPFPIVEGPEGDVRLTEVEQEPIKKQVDFSEDNGEAILILLRIAHLQFNKVPTSLPFSTLLEVAVLCDQYDCVKIVLPWLSQWCAEEEKESVVPGQEQWLFISWVFGREDVFHNLAERLVRQVAVNNAGACVGEDGQALKEPMPPGIIESILEIRLVTIAKFLRLVYDDVDRLSDGNLMNDGECTEDCCAFKCGSLIRQLSRCTLWPRLGASAISYSVEELAMKLGEIEISTCSYRCEPAYYREQAEEIISAMATPVLESHLQHMAAANEPGSIAQMD